MIKIYDLRDDKYHIGLVQDATLNTKEFGLKPEHGLFGSQDWWEAIERGVIQKHIIEGVISRVYMSGHNDFPEFEITSNDGNKTSWERMGDDNFYVVGKRVRLIYVMQKFKKPLPGGHTKAEKERSKCSHNVLEMWLED